MKAMDEPEIRLIVNKALELAVSGQLHNSFG